MRQVAVVALFLAAALSGCAGGEYMDVNGYNPQPEPVQDTNSTVDSNTTVNETVEEVPIVGDLLIGVDNTTFAAGTPFNVSVAFYPDDSAPENATTNVTEAPVYSDVFWSLNMTQGNLTVFQNGTSLPAIISVNATDAANMTLSAFLIMDGQVFQASGFNMTATVEEVVVVAEPFAPISVEFELLYGCPFCTEDWPTTSGAVTAAAMLEGLTVGWVALPPNAVGMPYTAASSTLLYAGDADGVFTTACTADSAIVAWSLADGSEEGLVPEGAGCLFVWEYFADAIEPVIAVTVG